MWGKFCGLIPMDAFSRLGLPRKLVIDVGKLDEVVREMSRSVHPDAGGDAREFEEVRQAGEVLKSPSGRVRLALELAGGEWVPRGSVDDRVMDFFAPVAGVLEKVDEFVSARATSRSVLGRAILDGRVPSLKSEIDLLIRGLGELEGELVGRFEKFDESGWEVCLSSMAETARALSFVTKWQAQLRAATGNLFEALLGA